jgi:hypothetical protein
MLYRFHTLNFNENLHKGIFFSTWKFKSWRENGLLIFKANRTLKKAVKANRTLKKSSPF